jgi:pimeloyl-ACP methyl ester carboxylesterase
MLTLLAHGLGRTPISMFPLAVTLRRAGHRTQFFGYSPTFETVPRVVERLAARLRVLARFDQPVGLIGHSLGGLLLRSALAEVPELRVRRLVMLGTPNRPPRLAARAWQWLPFRVLTGDGGRFLATPARHAVVPLPTVPYTILAGTAGPCGRYSPFGDDVNDGIVSVSETLIRPENQPELFPVWHSFMMNNPVVRRRIVAILSEGDTSDALQ